MQTEGFGIQRHSELEDLEAELLSMVCKDIEVEPVQFCKRSQEKS